MQSAFHLSFKCDILIINKLYTYLRVDKFIRLCSFWNRI